MVVTGAGGAAAVTGPDPAVLASIRDHAQDGGGGGGGGGYPGAAAGPSRAAGGVASGKSAGAIARASVSPLGPASGRRGRFADPSPERTAAVLQDRDSDAIRGAARQEAGIDAASGDDQAARTPNTGGRSEWDSPPRGTSGSGAASGARADPRDLPLPSWRGEGDPDRLPAVNWARPGRSVADARDASGTDSSAAADWLALGLEDQASAAAYVGRPSTAEAALLTSDELFLRKVANNMRKLVAGRQPVVLVSTGAFNPIHLQHTRMFYLARAHLNERTEYQVVGGLVSPSHDTEVKNSLRVFPSQAVPIRHRSAMCEIAVSGSSWLAVGRWEATRRRVMPYHSVLQHVQELLNNAFGGSAKPAAALAAEELSADLHDDGYSYGDAASPTGRRGIAPGKTSAASSPPTGRGSPRHARGGGGAARVVPRVMYLCGADKLLQAGPQTLRTFGCICCARPGFTDELRRIVGRRYRRLVHVVDDDALLPTSLDSVSSTKVRRRMLAGKEVTSLVGEAVGSYIRSMGIADKVAGRQEWTDQDKEHITYNAAAAVRAAQERDKTRAGGHVHAHNPRQAAPSARKRVVPGTLASPSLSSANGSGGGGGSVPTLPRPGAGPKVSPLMIPSRGAKAGPSPSAGLGGAAKQAARGRQGALASRTGLGRAGAAVLSSGSLPEFASGPSRAGPALGGGFGRRHWPGGESRPAGAPPVKAVVVPPSAPGIASGRNRPRASLAAANGRRAWSGGPRRHAGV
ncbi:hypothetical protein FNF29_01149 [Cafeteria roenbergensis]|uniref:Uncharacterized protein n=2 Tax=Cafeteria roenbergensis TaxID=33653 RepID=A0A5A8CTF9_CAFRO|nr:hypothetical protein FNF29_01149 [Cafeteria roenbergensis]|eukprot:KAA0156356.1 hypothetical protein FNF29_01149 [Cafeteria roenbergensis]